MAYTNIKNIRSASVEPIKYFVDANIWIYSMQDISALRWWEVKYADFFFDIIDSNLDPKPQIIVPSLLISEIINTFIKKIAFSEYKALNGVSATSNFDFKRDYRPTQHYNDSFEKICDDILAYKASIEFVNDSRLLLNPDEILNIPSINFDFNDHFYYRLCKEINLTTPLTLLTNDGDFQVSDLKIITANQSLLAL